MSVQSQKPPKPVFLATFIVVFFCTVSAADSVGFVPEYIDGSSPSDSAQDQLFATNDSPSTSLGSVALADLPQLGDKPATSYQPPAISVLPEQIKIPAIDLDLPVLNPETRDLKTLDAIIQKGPARYVDSAKLGASGNMIIFAHSSVYPVLKNQMWKAFNRIHELKVGDPITLEAQGKQYIYTVTSVRSADVSDTVIDLSPTQGSKLTLITCDILTGKSARFVVEADFVGVVTM